MNKEAIESIKQIIAVCDESIESDRLEGFPRQPIGRSDTFMIRNTLSSFLTLLRAAQTREPECKTCDDTEQVGEEIFKYGRSMGFRECLDCKPEEPETGEFTKEMAEKYGRGTVRTYLDAVHDLYEACDIIDRQAAELDKKPKAGIFEIRIPNLKPEEVPFVRSELNIFTKELLNDLTKARNRKRDEAAKAERQKLKEHGIEYN